MPGRRVLGWIVQGAAIAAVSVYLLVERGPLLCQPLFFLPLACFSAVLAGPMALRERSLFRVAAKASALMAAVIGLSLTLVNLAYGEHGAVIPAVMTAFWALVLAPTAAFASAAVLKALSGRVSPGAVRWGFRASVLVAVLAYRALPLGWTIFWLDRVDEWGLSGVALVWWLPLAAAAWLAAKAQPTGCGSATAAGSAGAVGS